MNRHLGRPAPAEPDADLTAGETPEHESGASHHVSIEQVFDAPSAQLYRSFTQPALLERWFGPDGVQVATGETAVDLREGGLLHLVMIDSVGSGSRTGLDLVFERIETDRHLVLGDAWFNAQTQELIHTQLELTLTALPDGRCRLLLHQGPFSDLMAGAAELAWSESLDKLDRTLRHT